MTVIEAVYRFPNGMVMVFDIEGKQIPRYQGKWSEMRELIEANSPDHVSIKHNKWDPLPHRERLFGRTETGRWQL